MLPGTRFVCEALLSLLHLNHFRLEKPIRQANALHKRVVLRAGEGDAFTVSFLHEALVYVFNGSQDTFFLKGGEHSAFKLLHITPLFEIKLLPI
jgi:hypothetical protein